MNEILDSIVSFKNFSEQASSTSIEAPVKSD